MSSANFWTGRRVLVTGADGFIGSHLVERLTTLGAKVRAFVYYNSFGSWGWLDTATDKIKNELDVFPGDIRDAGRVEEACRDQDTIFHLASLIAIPYSYSAPESYIDTNIRGALNVAKGALSSGVRHVLHTSTSEVYGTAQTVPIAETHPLQGQSPYSASKIGADMLMDSFHRSFEMPLTIVRPFNTYGPRQSARAIIPTIISQLLNDKKEIQLGSLHPTRDLNFVSDTAEAFVKIAESDKVFGKTLNVGSGREITVGDLAELIMKVSGKSAKIITDPSRLRPKSSEVDRLLCDSSECQRLTGWRPSVSLEVGLEMTIRWIQENLFRFKAGQYQT